MILAVAACLVHTTPVLLTDRVAIVRNLDSAVSRRVAVYYAGRRRISGIIDVHAPDSAVSAKNETISFVVYREGIEKPIRVYLRTHPNVDFLLLTKGIPIRIADSPGRGLGNNRPSLDSYLAALDYDRDHRAADVAIRDSGFSGTAWANRFWRSRERFSHARFGGYLVSRLDGYTEADAKALVDRALEAEMRPPTGTVLLDTCKAFGYADSPQPVELFTTAPKIGEKLPPMADINFNHFNADMRKSAAILRERKIPVELDEEDAFVGDRSGLMGYVSWGSNDRFYKANAYRSLRFAPGAVSDTAVSTSGRTFLPTQGGQSLIADLIAQGVTGVKGYTDEPLLTAIASPSVLFERYTSGWTLAESFYASSRFVGWEDIVIGDPICRPYARRPALAPRQPDSAKRRNRP